MMLDEGIKFKRKIFGRNLKHGPRTWLVRDFLLACLIFLLFWSLFDKVFLDRVVGSIVACGLFLQQNRQLRMRSLFEAGLAMTEG